MALAASAAECRSFRSVLRAVRDPGRLPAAFRLPPSEPLVLIDATEWLDNPVFGRLSGGVSGCALLEAFDVHLAALDAMLSQMARPDRSPVFGVDFSGGHRVQLVWRNFDEDAGWDYLLTDARSERSVLFAALECHFQSRNWSTRHSTQVCGAVRPAGYSGMGSARPDISSRG